MSLSFEEIVLKTDRAVYSKETSTGSLSKTQLPKLMATTIPKL